MPLDTKQLPYVCTRDSCVFSALMDGIAFRLLFNRYAEYLTALSSSFAIGCVRSPLYKWAYTAGAQFALHSRHFLSQEANHCFGCIGLSRFACSIFSFPVLMVLNFDVLTPKSQRYGGRGGRCWRGRRSCPRRWRVFYGEIVIRAERVSALHILYGK